MNAPTATTCGHRCCKRSIARRVTTLISPAGSITRGRALAIGGSLGALALGRAAFADDAPQIRIGASPAAAQALPYFAQQMGILKSAGITVSIAKFSGAAALQGVVGGDLDIGATTPISIANAVAHGIPIRMIGIAALITPDDPPFGLYVAKDSTIHTARDLNGKTVGVNSLHDSQTLGVWAWLEKGGVPHDSTKFVEAVFSTAVPALERGSIAAAALIEPYITAAKGSVREIPGVYETLGKRWAIGAFYCSNAFYAKDPALVKRFMDAMYTTAKRVNRNPIAVEPMLATYSQIAPDALHAMRRTIFAESTEASTVQPQLDIANQFREIPRAMTTAELMGDTHA